jgi:hypothetical protein
MQTQDAKQFSAAITLRNLITKTRIYRQPSSDRIILLQHYADAVCSLYDMPEVVVHTPHVMDVLVALHGINWAHAVYALASPSLYVKNVCRLTSRVAPLSLYLPFVGAVNVSTVDELVAKWGEVFTKYLREQGGVVGEVATGHVGAAVSGNVAMSLLYNEAVGETFAIPVFDEDAAPAEAPVQVNNTRTLIDAGDDEEADFNATH